MRGRKPTSEKILKLRGSPRVKGRAPEPAGIVEVPEAPGWMVKEAREKWIELAGILVRRGVLTATDCDRLADYCVSYARWRKAERTLKARGEVVLHSNGVTGLNHWLRVAEGALARMDRAGTVLGLSPVDRQRLKDLKPQATSADGMAKFFKGRA